MSRLAGGSLAMPLNTILYEDLPPLREARREEDTRIRERVGAVEASRLDEPLVYRNMRGEELTTPIRLVLGHLFNHETHHRGQVHDMLSQTAMAPPELDFILFVRMAGVA
jgi:uncharacterized damage-inducible protein DinB